MTFQYVKKLEEFLLIIAQSFDNVTFYVTCYVILRNNDHA